MPKTYSLIWIPQALREAGLKVIEVPGWQQRGIGEMLHPQGVILHHTAGSSKDNMPSLDTIVRGRSDLRGPLAQLGLGRDGTYYMVAAGRANHAGRGAWGGISEGNSHFIGIEAEDTGYTKGPRAEAWSEKQLDAYVKGVAALLKYIKAPVKMAIGHKEWATPHGRKVDPTFDMPTFRERVEKELEDGSGKDNQFPLGSPKGVS